VLAIAIGPRVTAAAEPPTQTDQATVEACLKKAGDKPETCIGTVADPCLQNAESTADMNGCYDREIRVWDGMLNAAYKGLQPQLDAKQAEALRDVQRSWIAYRDKRCAFYWTFYQGTIASPMGGACVNDETARRALDLRGLQKGLE
jgi:uncharacterized protein YecT (DUF1311 family)